jgi:hypothetical protein
MAKGKRLTCPYCKDSSFFTLEQIEAMNGRVQCGNHLAPIEMVDLVALLEILTVGQPLERWQQEEFEAVVDAGLIHPQDFEFEEVEYD